MAAESSEGEEEAGKLTGGNHLLVVDDDLREMGKKAAWSVSSYKPGNGVSSLRDNNLETYWQLLTTLSTLSHFLFHVPIFQVPNEQLLYLLLTLISDLTEPSLIWSTSNFKRKSNYKYVNVNFCFFCFLFFLLLVFIVIDGFVYALFAVSCSLCGLQA